MQVKEIFIVIGIFLSLVYNYNKIWNRMDADKMKKVKMITTIIIVLPFIILGLFIVYEFLGAVVNHNATNNQTRKLKHNIERVIDDVQIIQVQSKTGNTSGTGNHVDCYSKIVFSTKIPLADIKIKISEYYELSEYNCYIEELDGGQFAFILITSAPFSDNIEGH